MSPPKNPAAVSLGRLGGKASSEAKTLAARLNAQKPRPRNKQLTTAQSLAMIAARESKRKKKGGE